MTRRFWQATRLIMLIASCLLMGQPAPGQTADTMAQPVTQQFAADSSVGTVDGPLDSPRALMHAFLAAMNEARRTPVHEQDWQHAASMMDTSLIPDDQIGQAAVQLAEVIDKLGAASIETLPDAQRVHDARANRYALFPYGIRDNWVYEELKAFGRWPEGSIVMVRQPNGQWQFSAATVAGIDRLHRSMEPLPPRHLVPQPGDEETELAGVLGATFTHTPWWGWAGLLASIFVGLLLGKCTQATCRKTADKLEQRNWLARATILRDAASPASFALLTAGLAIGLQFLHLDQLAAFTNQVLVFFYLIAIGWFAYNLIELIDVFLLRAASKTKGSLDDVVVGLIRKTLRIFVVILFAIVILQNVFELNITGFLASLGIAGLAISLAAQDSIKNLFGSLTVFLDHPFAVGQRITFEGMDGIVQEIGFRSTKLRTLTGHLITVPNMKFIDTSVENIAARPYLRRILDLNIPYNTPLEKIQEAVQIVRDILTEPEMTTRFQMDDWPPRVFFDEYNAASLNIKVFYWYYLDDDHNYWTFLEHAQTFNLKVYEAFHQAGIEFAIPAQRLHLVGSGPTRKLEIGIERGDGQQHLSSPPASPGSPPDSPPHSPPEFPSESSPDSSAPSPSRAPWGERV